MSGGLVARVRAFCRRHGLLEPGPVVAAVSGGLDSVVLLHVLLELGVRPLVATVDHGLRPEAAREAAGVVALARRLGLPWRAVALGLEPGPGAQARARSARLAWLASLGAGSIALGHHLDDQAETVLHRAVRGSGAGGLAAMAPRRGPFVRPLLEEPRAALRAWAEARGLAWIEDPSNRHGTRGALRHRVLPELERIQPGASRALARLARRAAEDEDVLGSLAAALLDPHGGVPRRAWSEAPPAVRRRAALAVVRAAGTEPSSAVLDALLAGAPRAALPGGAEIGWDGAVLRCLPPVPPPSRLVRGRWGPWEVQASGEVVVRAPRRGERWRGRALAERLRAAGIGRLSRARWPVVVREERRFVPLLGVDGGRVAGVEVSCSRRRLPSLPPGGPYRAKL